MNHYPVKLRISHIWYLVIPYCLLLCYYITKKSAVASMTHDESFSYLHYVHATFMDIISNQGAFSNNHLLNTLGMKYSEMVFGNSEIALRLPNLLALPLFLFYSFLILRRCHPVIGVSAFVILTANNTLIDFFGLARGYGLSIAFMVMSLYHLSTALDRRKNLNLTLFGVGSLLAILSNFTLLTVYLACLLIYNVLRYLEDKGSGSLKFKVYRENKVNLIMLAIMFIILYEPVRKAIKFNKFDFGGQVSIWNDTISSVVFQIFTNIQMPPVFFMISRLAVVFIIILPWVVLSVKIFQSGKSFIQENRFLVILNMVLTLVLFINFIQHNLLGTSYLTGRFALFLVPLVVLNAAFLMEYVARKGYWKPVFPIVIAVAVFAGFNFYRQMDYRRCAEWGYDSDTRNAVMALMQDYAESGVKKDKIRLGVNWLFEPTVNYYRLRYHLYWLLPAGRSGVSDTDDYCYIFENEQQKVSNLGPKVIFSSESEGTLLVRLDGHKP